MPGPDKSNAELMREVQSLRARLSELQGKPAQSESSALALRDAEAKYRTLVEQIPAITYTALRESEVRYGGLFERMPIGLYSCAPDGRILDVNQTAVQMLGYPSREALLQVSAWAIIIDADAVERATGVTVPEGIGERAVVRARRHDGTIVMLRATVTAVMDSTGNVIRYEGSLEDITERRRAEAQIAYQANLLSRVKDPVFAIDKNWRLTFWNAAAEEAYGWKSEEALGQLLRDLTKVEYLDAGMTPEQLNRTLREKGTYRGEIIRHCKDGTARHVDLTITVLKDETGALTGYVSADRDITERKVAERALETVLRLHQTTLATIPSLLLVLDGQLNVVLANEKSLTVHNFSSSDILGRNIRDIFPSLLHDRQSLYQRIRAVLKKSGQDELQGVKHSVPGLGDRYLDIRICAIAPIKGRKGEPRVLLVINDVTQHRVLTEQLNRASKMESIGRLAGGVAHDFNNILTGIIGHTEMLLKQSGQDTTIHNKLGKVRDLSNRAAQLTRQLLAFGRRQPMQLSILNLNDLAEEVSKMFQRVLGEDIQLELRLAPKLGSVQADPDQIEQTLMNLAINARDAMPNGGRLTIETANVRLDREYAGQRHNVQPGPHVMLSVSDTGCGMSPEVLSHLFEPFFTTKPPGRGTGLGLASVYGIVQQHKGSIEVQSQPNAGATFRIFLPRVRGKPQPRREADVAEVETRGTETILLVEDEQAVRELAESVLKEKGYTVYSSAHPSEAEALVARRGEEISLLLSDVVLPECSGPKLYQRLSPKYPALKVLYISGYSQETLSFKPDGAGKLLLRKPFTPTELAAKVRAVLDAKPVRERSRSSPRRQTRRST